MVLEVQPTVLTGLRILAVAAVALGPQKSLAPAVLVL
jgi:hypothetical protein